jgi:hypothetical protein
MRDLLFSVPWYLPTLLAIVGLALFVSGNRRQKPQIRAAGVAVIGLAVLWAVVSYLVETPKEICERQTRQYVKSVVDRDWATFNKLMEPQVQFTDGTDWHIDGRDTWSDDVKSGAEQIGLKGASITSLIETESTDSVTATITVYSTQAASLDRPVESEWTLEWRASGGHWLLHELRPVQVSGMTLDQVRGELRKH